MFISQKGIKLLEKTSSSKVWAEVAFLDHACLQGNDNTHCFSGFHSAFIKSDGSLGVWGKMGVVSWESIPMRMPTLPPRWMWVPCPSWSRWVIHGWFRSLCKSCQAASFLSEQGAQLIEAQQVITEWVNSRV